MTTPKNRAALSQHRPLRPMASTWGYFGAIMGLGLVSASLGPTLLELAENTNSDISQLSYLFLSRSTGYMLGSVIGGRIIDSLPGNRVLGVALVAIAIFMFIVPLMTVLALLAIVLLMIGLSEGQVDMGSNTLLIWTHRDGVGPYMNALHFFFGVGAFVSPIIVVQLLDRTGSVNLVYWALAILVLPVGLWLVNLPSPRHIPSKQTTTSGHTNVLLLTLVALFMFTYVGAEVSFGGWIYTYAATLGLASVTTAGYLTSAYWGALTFGRLVGIPLARVWRPRTILAIDILGSIASVATILIWREQSWAVWVGTVGLGFFNGTIFATMFLWAERRMEMTGSISRWFFVGASLGAMTFPWLSGQLFGRVSPYAFMMTVLLLFVANLLLFWLLMRIGGDAREDEVVAQSDAYA